LLADLGIICSATVTGSQPASKDTKRQKCKIVDDDPAKQSKQKNEIRVSTRLGVLSHVVKHGMHLDGHDENRNSNGTQEHPKPPEPPAHAKRHEREAQVPWPIERHFVKQNSTHMARLTIKLRHSCWKESYAKAKNYSNIQNHTKLERQRLSAAAHC
jgi:hypothetical protein